MEARTEENINLGSYFFESLVKQIRSTDAYGAFSKYDDEQLIEMKYVKAEGQEVTPADQMGFHIKVYLQTLAVALERLGGHIVGLMTETGCDGSVKAVFYSGQLILMDKTFGGISGMQYKSTEKLKEAGGKLLKRLLSIANERHEKYKELMG